MCASPSRATQLSNELSPVDDVVGLWRSQMMISVGLDLCIRVQAQGSLTLTPPELTPPEQPSTDLTRTSTSDLVAAPNTTVCGDRAKLRRTVCSE